MLSTALFLPVDHESSGQLVSGFPGQSSNAWVIESPRAAIFFGNAADAADADIPINEPTANTAASATRIRVTIPSSIAQDTRRSGPLPPHPKNALGALLN